MKPSFVLFKCPHSRIRRRHPARPGLRRTQADPQPGPGGPLHPLRPRPRGPQRHRLPILPRGLPMQGSPGEGWVAGGGLCGIWSRAEVLFGVTNNTSPLGNDRAPDKKLFSAPQNGKVAPTNDWVGGSVLGALAPPEPAAGGPPGGGAPRDRCPGAHGPPRPLLAVVCDERQGAAGTRPPPPSICSARHCQCHCPVLRIPVPATART